MSTDPSITTDQADEDSFPFTGYVRQQRVAKYLGVSDDTIRRWERAGRLPRAIRSGVATALYDAAKVRAAAAAMEGATDRAAA